MCPVILVIDAKATLGIVNDPPFVSKSSSEMPNQQFENVIFRLNFREIGAIRHTVETDHAEHASDFTPDGAGCHENRKHLVGGGIFRVSGIGPKKHLAEVCKNFHLDSVFFGAECGIKCRKDFRARLVRYGPLKSLGGLFRSLDSERLHKEVAGRIAAVWMNFADIQMLAVDFKDDA